MILRTISSYATLHLAHLLASTHLVCDVNEQYPLDKVQASLPLIDSSVRWDYSGFVNGAAGESVSTVIHYVIEGLRLPTMTGLIALDQVSGWMAFMSTDHSTP